MKTLKGKVVLVTGGASGIGLATVRRFAEAGCKVALADINGNAAKAAANVLQADGLDVQAYTLDVRREAPWTKVIAQIERQLGPLHVVVNNAGIGRSVPLLETTLAFWREITSVNLDGVFLGTKHGVAALARNGGGAIVNISSIRGVAGFPGSSAYCASKAGVRLLSKVAALECAAAKNGVRINCILPGYVETPLVAKQLSPAIKRRITKSTPMSRLAKPEEIADAIFYLASPQASYVTGTDLLVDGGFVAQ